MRAQLEQMGFEINPYYPCVANKTVGGSQMTVTWHVDDLKVSHKDPVAVTTFLYQLGKLYKGQLTVTRGTVHTYLGMDFDFSTKKAVKLSMIPYSQQILTNFPEEITTTSTTPAADHLFTVRADDDPGKRLLPERQAQFFTIQLHNYYFSPRERIQISKL